MTEQDEIAKVVDRVINELIGNAINRIKDQSRWDEALLREAHDIELIEHAIEEI